MHSSTVTVSEAIKQIRVQEAQLAMKLLEKRDQSLREEIKMHDQDLLELNKQYKNQEDELVKMVTKLFEESLVESKIMPSTGTKQVSTKAANAKTQALQQAKDEVASNHIVLKLYELLGLNIDNATKLMQQILELHSSNLDTDLEAFKETDLRFPGYLKKANDIISVVNGKLHALLKSQPPASINAELISEMKAMNAHVKNLEDFTKIVYVKKHQTTLTKVRDNLQKACSIRKQMKDIAFTPAYYPLETLRKNAEFAENVRNDYLRVRGDELETFANKGDAALKIVEETKSKRDKVLELQSVINSKANPVKEEAKAENQPAAVKKPLVPTNQNTTLAASAAQLSTMGLLARSNAAVTASPANKVNPRVGMTSSA